jgi:hypothetical protein
VSRCSVLAGFGGICRKNPYPRVPCYVHTPPEARQESNRQLACRMSWRIGLVHPKSSPRRRMRVSIGISVRKEAVGGLYQNGPTWDRFGAATSTQDGSMPEGEGQARHGLRAVGAVPLAG